MHRLRTQNDAILARLRRGPATNAELSQMSLKYTSRISDLRAAGHDIKCVYGDNGLNTYRLVIAPKQCCHAWHEVDGRYGRKLECAKCGKFYGYLRLHSQREGILTCGQSTTHTTTTTGRSEQAGTARSTQRRPA